MERQFTSEEKKPRWNSMWLLNYCSFVDIDECTSGTHNCHIDANCTNTKGSFYCTCHAGYSGDGVICEDIIECQSEALAPNHSNYAHNCHDDANCTNTKGSFYCTCHYGYSGDGVTCSDLDECFPDQLSEQHLPLAHNCHGDANCTNTKGSFYCTCLNGYSGNGVACVGRWCLRCHYDQRLI